MDRRALVMALVVLLHGLLLAAACFARVEPPRQEKQALTVSLLSDPAPPRDEKPRALPPDRLMTPMPAVIVDTAPAIEFPVTETPTAPTPAGHVASAAPASAGPESLETELAVQCPERTAPRYPALASQPFWRAIARVRYPVTGSWYVRGHGLVRRHMSNSELRLATD